MAYTTKDVFYLDLELTLPTGGSVGSMESVQLDLSAYIDPIARGKQKGVGLAVYKVHYSISATGEGYTAVPQTESGVFRGGLIAGAGLGSQTGATFTGTANSPTTENPLCIMAFDYYGPDAFVGVTAAPGPPGPLNRTFLEPSTDVPYIVVRDNVCAVAIYGNPVFQTLSYLAMRLEVAQITLDSNTLNQLLRTQTV